MGKLSLCTTNLRRLLELKQRSAVRQGGVERWEKVLRVRSKGTNTEVESALKSKRQDKAHKLFCSCTKETFEVKKRRIQFGAFGVLNRGVLTFRVFV